MGESSLLEFGEQLGSGCIKISMRQGWIRLSFLSQESPYVSAVFLEQSLRAIFRMSLKMYEEAFPL